MSSWTIGRTSRLLALMTVVGLLALPTTEVSADTNANTDDSNISTPTGWWTYTGVTPAQIGSYLSANGARLTDIESYDAAANRWTVTMVRNAGAYATPAWWWYYGLTGAQVSEKLSANSARLIHLQPYRVSGATRFAAVMVRNTGAQAREWYWGYGTTAANIGSHLSAKGTRLTDLETYYEGSTKRYAFVSVKNAGDDANTWYWWLNQSTSSLGTKLKDTGSRLIDLERQPDGTYNAVAVRGTGSDAAQWWYRPAFRSLAEVNNYAAQLATRPLDVETYLTAGGHRRYDAVFIDNANPATRRIRGIFAERFLDADGNPTRGIFEAYLKRVGGSVLVNLNPSRRAETASSLKALHLLHTMRRVQAGTDFLDSSFVYYNYPSMPWPNGLASNACPNPDDETAANKKTDYDLEKGVDEMMLISDNRTTRGVVLRYGGFAPLNSTAATIGMTGTTLRHNIGCAYGIVGTDPLKYSTGLRNDTTAADLARIYDTVWTGSSLSGTPRAEFLESARPTTGSESGLRAIIDEEAAALGKSPAEAWEFAQKVRKYSKAGSYGTCLPASDGSCGQTVMIASAAGIIRFPAKSPTGLISYRTYVFARLVSDVPTGCSGCPSDSDYTATYQKASLELYREEIRSALSTW